MSHNLLKGKKGIIFGALNDMSIAWKVAERAHEEGATFTLTNAPIAMRMGAINDLAAHLLHLWSKTQKIRKNVHNNHLPNVNSLFQLHF